MSSSRRRRTALALSFLVLILVHPAYWFVPFQSAWWVDALLFATFAEWTVVRVPLASRAPALDATVDGFQTRIGARERVRFPWTAVGFSALGTLWWLMAGSSTPLSLLPVMAILAGLATLPQSFLLVMVRHVRHAWKSGDHPNATRVSWRGNRLIVGDVDLLCGGRHRVELNPGDCG